MTRLWQLQEAKSKFSELVELAIADGPQVVTKRGVDAVIVLSLKDFHRLKKPKNSLISFFNHSPKCNLNVDRKKDLDREMEL